MQVLTVLTAVYAGLLVLVLAASLIAILVFLRRIGGLLGDVGDTLAQALDDLVPLESHMRRLKAPCDECADELARVEESLSGVRERLEEIARPSESVTH